MPVSVHRNAKGPGRDRDLGEVWACQGGCGSRRGGRKRKAAGAGHKCNAGTLAVALAVLL